jgi:2-phosphosulfolactate phosphatase
MTDEPAFSQSSAVVKLEWGWHGCAMAAARGDIVVIVDVLRFSTACAAAVARGISIIPAAMEDDLAELARRHDAILPEAGFARLSPLAYAKVPPGTRLVVKSPNGATCAGLAGAAPLVAFGSFVNASATARFVAGMASQTAHNITIVACGERWSQENRDGQLRFAIEDYLGAGAILAGLTLEKSAEATLCSDAFTTSGPRLVKLLLNCASGRELIERGLTADVEMAAKLDSIDAVPVLAHGAILQAPLR